jgi:prolipoprotein diacylglyceryltransferase
VQTGVEAGPREFRFSLFLFHFSLVPMQQVLFTVPILKDWFPPDGLPIYGFGAMLFVTFILVTVWGTMRARKIGMEAARFQDFTIWVFVSGIIGARILYMIQYAQDFHDHSLAGMAGAFFRIWEGGIVFYGSALGGAIGYGLFYWFVMRRLHVSGWQLADAVAPLLAMGLAIGRIGCYLNGCCWGQVANEEACPVPLGSAHFPLLPAHARTQLVTQGKNVPYGFLQTTTGFAIQPKLFGLSYDDPRAVVVAVEQGSEAAKAGVMVGDRVVKVNGRPNWIVMEFSAPEKKAGEIEEALKPSAARVTAGEENRVRAEFGDLPEYREGKAALARVAPEITPHVFDRLDEVTSAANWPRGKSELTLSVKRAGEDGQSLVVDLPTFSPRTVGLYPTQLYETVSMVLLIFLLLAYYPFRRHDGQLMVLLMMGYAVHRFVNESLRIEPAYAWGLTLSQWGSVVVFAAAVVIELYLWRVMPSRWEGQAPGPTPAVPTAPRPVNPAAKDDGPGPAQQQRLAPLAPAGPQAAAPPGNFNPLGMFVPQEEEKRR